jgi:hypothetical protein
MIKGRTLSAKVHALPYNFEPRAGKRLLPFDNNRRSELAN